MNSFRLPRTPLMTAFAAETCGRYRSRRQMTADLVAPRLTFIQRKLPCCLRQM